MFDAGLMRRAVAMMLLYMVVSNPEPYCRTQGTEPFLNDLSHNLWPRERQCTYGTRGV